LISLFDSQLFENRRKPHTARRKGPYAFWWRTARPWKTRRHAMKLLGIYNLLDAKGAAQGAKKMPQSLRHCRGTERRLIS
jgi:hypothetical protein